MLNSKGFLLFVAILVFHTIGIAFQQRIIVLKSQLVGGVPVDYSYNETSLGSNSYSSVPGCPMSINGYPWVLYGKDKPRCYLVGHPAQVCESFEVIQLQPGSQFGVCACDFEKCVRNNGTLEETKRYTFCSNMQCEKFAYDNVKARCFKLYAQGPCKAHEWLSRGNNEELECRRKLCEDYEGLNDQDERRYSFNKSTSKQDISCCYPIPLTSSRPNVIPPNACSQGTVYSANLEDCLPRFENSGFIVG